MSWASECLLPYFLKRSFISEKGQLRKFLRPANLEFLTGDYGNQFPNYIVSINRNIIRILKFKDETTALYQYIGHQLPSEASPHPKQSRPLNKSHYVCVSRKPNFSLYKTPKINEAAISSYTTIYSYENV